MNFIPTLPAFKTPDPSHPAVVFSARLDSVLGPLLLLIAAKVFYLGRFTIPLWTRVSRARIRLARLLNNLAAGRLPRRRAATPGRKGGPPAPYSPHGNLWLVRILGYHAAGRAAQINTLLSDPAMQAAIAAAPTAARTLRPLCRMLGIDLPASLQRMGMQPPETSVPPRAPPRPWPRAAKPSPFLLREEPAPAPILIVFPLSS